MKRTSRSAEDADLEVLCYIYFFLYIMEML